MKQKIAILISGSGSNALNICRYFRGHEQIEVAILLSNRENSGAKAIGEEFGIPYFIFNREQFYQTGEVLQQLKERDVSTLVLAGFLWLIPDDLLDQYPDHIINIHPALLPKYGGKGMHGMHVHEAVRQNREKVSGISIHLCNREYDKGKILYQKSVELHEQDTAETISKRVLQIEHEYYPRVIEAYLSGKDLTGLL